MPGDRVVAGQVGRSMEGWVAWQGEPQPPLFVLINATSVLDEHDVGAHPRVARARRPRASVLHAHGRSLTPPARAVLAAPP